MNEIKNRSLLIQIANSLKSIDENVWINYILKKCKNKENCIIDDLRFENELTELINDSWYFIVLQVRKEEELKNKKSISR